MFGSKSINHYCRGDEKRVRERDIERRGEFFFFI